MKKTSTGKPRLPEYMTTKELEARGACEHVRFEVFEGLFPSGRAKVSKRNLRRMHDREGIECLLWLLETYHVPGGMRRQRKVEDEICTCPDEKLAECRPVEEAFGLR